MTDQPESAPPIDEDGMWPPYCNPHYVMPEEIEVKVAMNHGEYYFTVGIEKFQAKKPFLGGFRNKYTGHVYHHGSSQTPTESKFTMKNMNDLQCRETQTYEYTTLSVQPYRESGTQMERKDLKIDTKRDVILYPRRYFTADQLNEVKKEKCIIIQRVWRGYLARCLATKYRQQNEDHQLRHREKYDSEINAEKEKRKQDMLRRLHPVTKNDFEILYNELDLWRRQESQKIKVCFVIFCA